ncbi:TPA: hypothetical protein PXJ37_002393 [Yersinia enterocolitica]|uniref:hypothetical protein n=1 Tax=Yersinia TaxID=629 RepID=UPI0005DD0C8D|nr:MULTISPECIES: hypothetical protein [Yersinia]EKN3395827.1 hypothetical protein [Yersinia enterocolitica]EKN3530778.1 hypothetical protein [Yersinia enterocolitica]EKN3571685.1 hypothetical protein [Yersinia enterocolitica]EKN3634487.1 hypothetical protein [Yersinia enterocolitica]EKN3834337.1 hypothetical protein [Yersinia enterocolitica]
MNNLINKLPMDSLAIAELADARHYDAKRSIERLASRGAIQAPAIRLVGYVNNLGFTVKRTVYFFEGAGAQHDIAVVLARLCKEFTPKLPPYHGAKITFLQAISQEVAV